MSLWPLAAEPIQTPEVAPDGPAKVLPRQECPTEITAFHQLRALQNTLQENRQALAIAQAQEELATGKPLEWPTDLPEGFDEASIEAVLEDIALAHDGTVLGIDCGEYPCVAVLAWRGTHFEEKGAAHDEVRETYPGLIGGGDAIWTASGGVDGHAFSIGLVPEGELSPELRERIQHRASEAKQIFDAHGFMYPDGVPEVDAED